MVGVTMCGMRQHLTRGLELWSPSSAGSRSQRRVSGLVTVLAAVLVVGTVAGFVLAAAGRGFGAAWPHAVQGPTAAIAFGIPAVLVLSREVRSPMGWLLGLVGV